MGVFIAVFIEVPIVPFMPFPCKRESDSESTDRAEIALFWQREGGRNTACPLWKAAGCATPGNRECYESQPLRHQRPLSELAQHGREQGRVESTHALQRAGIDDQVG